MEIKSYKDLVVWQKSMQLVREIYELTKLFPKDEQYALSNQMRRAVVSIPSNIAEGYKRKGLGEYIQFLSIANSSAAELETQLLITQDIYPNTNPSISLSTLEEIQKMLSTIIRKLKAKT